jgi:uncharacterized membrane protein YfcA
VQITLFKLVGYAVTGLAAGIIGGLLGIGGGAVMVPLLNLALDETMHVAVAASLFAMVFLSMTSVWGHRKNGYILKSVVVRLAPLATVSAVGGVIAGSYIPGWMLRKIFAVFLAYVAVDMVWRLVRGVKKGGDANEEPVSEFKPANEWVIPLIAIPMGFSCGVLGIGGGIIAVPALHVFLKLPLKNAIANSAATILFSATVAAVSKLIAIDGMEITRENGPTLVLAWQQAAVIGLLIAPTALVGGRVGALLTKKSPTSLIRALFAVMLIWAAVKFWTHKREAAASETTTPPAVTIPSQPGD